MLAPPCHTQVECRCSGRNVGVWRKDAGGQIFQICCSDAEEQRKEEKRNLGKHRSCALFFLVLGTSAHPVLQSEQAALPWAVRIR